jgi:hypothetical protein
MESAARLDPSRMRPMTGAQPTAPQPPLPDSVGRHRAARASAAARTMLWNKAAVTPSDDHLVLQVPLDEEPTSVWRGIFTDEIQMEFGLGRVHEAPVKVDGDKVVTDIVDTTVAESLRLALVRTVERTNARAAERLKREDEQRSQQAQRHLQVEAERLTQYFRAD